MVAIGSLKTGSGLEPVLRCEPSTYQPLADDITTAPSVPIRISTSCPRRTDLAISALLSWFLFV